MVANLESPRMLIILEKIKYDENMHNNSKETLLPWCLC